MIFQGEGQDAGNENADGLGFHGWKEEAGSWYYYEQGQKKTGWPVSYTHLVTFSPTLNTFLGLSTLPQDISEIWSKPSAPPKSMNAPKSVTFLTVPSTFWPTAMRSNLSLIHI